MQAQTATCYTVSASVALALSDVTTQAGQHVIYLWQFEKGFPQSYFTHVPPTLGKKAEFYINLWSLSRKWATPKARRARQGQPRFAASSVSHDR